MQTLFMVSGLAATIFAATLAAQSGPASAKSVSTAIDALELHGVKANAAPHNGRQATRLIEANDKREGGIALVKNAAFLNGEIRLDVAGRRGPFAQADDRGFVGVAFRVADGARAYEYFYVRPDNGRADDQERRNHSTQYAAHPDFPWQLLRKSFPGKYESYTDLESGAWTRLRVVVQGTTARLFVHDVTQPTLVVNDLKLPPASGGIGLWIGAGSEAFFAGLTVTPRP